MGRKSRSLSPAARRGMYQHWVNVRRHKEAEARLQPFLRRLQTLNVVKDEFEPWQEEHLHAIQEERVRI